MDQSPLPLQTAQQHLASGQKETGIGKHLSQHVLSEEHSKD